MSSCRLRSYLCLLGGVLGVLWLATPIVTGAQTEKAIPQAKTFFSLLVDGRYEKAFNRLSPTMQKFLPPDRMKAMMAAIRQQLGGFLGVDSTYVEKLDTLIRVHLISRFEKGRVDVQMVLEPSAKVAGLWFRPAEKPSYEAPAYTDTSRFREQELEFGRPAYRLKGTLSLPEGEGPFPVVVLVHGSGPNDRDETVGPNKPFRDLAWGLASLGIAVFRYDKRTYAYARKLAVAKITVEQEVIEDALLALQRVRQHPSVDSGRVYLLGHSLGGMLAPEIAYRDGRVAGVLLLAAPARPLDAVLMDQLTYIRSLKKGSPEAAGIDSLLQIVKKLAKGELDSSTNVLGAPASYYYDLRRRLPFTFAEKLQCRLLVLQAGRDYQVPETDKKMWKAFCEKIPYAEYKEYANLNHLFIAGRGMATPEEYATKKGHVAYRVIRHIADWIRSGRN
jgi:hypothetical protein